MHAKQWRQDTRNSVLLALCASALLWLACGVLLGALETAQRHAAEQHIQRTLDSMDRLLALQRQDTLDRVRSVAAEPRHQQLFAQLLRSPQDKQLQARYQRWITPIYLGRGFDGYSLMSADAGLLVAASSPAYVGRPLQTEGAHDVLATARREGLAISRPIIPPRLLLTGGKLQPQAQPFQVGCARIGSQARPVGFLCLRENPQRRLFRVLQAYQSGDSSMAYVVDARGQILSPVARYSGQGPMPPRYRDAREPGSGPGELGKFTQVVGLMLASRGNSGVQFAYPDYRGVAVVGAARWLPASAMGIVVEQDMAGLFAPYYFARNVALLLALAATLLIGGLSLAHWRARRRLALRDGMLAALRDNLPLAMHIKSPDGRYLMITPSFEALLQLQPGQAIGHTDAQLFTQPPLLQTTQEHATVLGSGEVTVVERCVPHAAPVQHYRLLCFPVHEPGSPEIVAICTVAVDITEQPVAGPQVEAQACSLEELVAERTRELAAARDLAEAAASTKTEFLANMSHEIRTPLNAIMGMTDLALQQPCAPQLRHYLQQVKGSSRHLLDIINNILDLSRIEAGKLPLDVAEFSLQGLLEHVAGLVWVAADAKSLQLSIDIGPGIADSLRGDAIRISQILTNFANNAVKFTRQGSVVLRVRCLFQRGEHLQLRFEVEDSGIGIAAEHLDTLFQSFQQLDGQPAQHVAGSGLGLAISKKLAELMGGNVSVQSQLGQGSIFALDVGLLVSHMAPLPAFSADGTPHVLVLTADRGLLAYLRARLNGCGLLLEHAATAVQARRMLTLAMRSNGCYSMLMLDMQLSGAQGMLEQLARPEMKLHGGVTVVLDDNAAATEVDSLQGVQELTLPRFPEDHVLVALCYGVQAMAVEEALLTRRTQLSGYRVLLVEDNALNQELVCGLLSRVGMQVVTVDCGEDALQQLQRQAFDVVLMDVHMPGMNGFVTTAQIRGDPRFAKLPIVALTARAMEGDRACCLAAGMSDYLTKPLKPALLFDVLYRYCAASRPAPGQFAVSPPPLAGSEIAGIDLQQGLASTMGNIEFYVRLLARVVNEQADLADRLQQAYEQGRWGDMQELLHSGRSVLGAIGARQLQQFCSDMEQLLAQPERLGLCLQQFVVDYGAMIHDGRRWLAAQAAPASRSAGAE